jgi:molybdopterin converting factor small subunit
MAVTVKLFAIYREILGESELRLEHVAGRTVDDLFTYLFIDKTPEPLRKATLFAINERYVRPGTEICDGDRVAFIPPVSGG